MLDLHERTVCCPLPQYLETKFRVTDNFHVRNDWVSQTSRSQRWYFRQYSAVFVEVVALKDAKMMQQLLASLHQREHSRRMIQHVFLFRARHSPRRTGPAAAWQLLHPNAFCFSAALLPREQTSALRWGLGGGEGRGFFQNTSFPRTVWHAIILMFSRQNIVCVWEKYSQLIDYL